MTKYLIYLLVILSIGIIGCDDDDSVSSGDSSFEFSEIGTVTGSSQSSGGSDLRIFHVSEYNVIITTSTAVQYWRNSCSGRNNGNVDDIHIGDTIEFKWMKVDIDYSITPHDVRVSNVEVWGPECWNVQNPEPEPDPCNSGCTNNCSSGCNNCNSGC